MDSRRFSNGSALLLVCLLLFPGGPTDAESESVEGCVCRVNKSAKSVTVFPWIKEKESWDADNPEVLAYDAEAKVIKAEFSLKLGPTEYKFADDATDVPSLEGRRAIVTWAEREGRKYATEFRLISGNPLGPATLGGMAGGEGRGAESSMKTLTRLCVACPCDRKPQSKP